MDLQDYRMQDMQTGFSLIKKSHAESNPRRHFHPWWELLYIESGERTFLYNTQVYTLTKGTFCVIPPLTLHRAINPEGETCSLYNIFFGTNETGLSPLDTRFLTIEPVLQSIKGSCVLNEALQKKVSSLLKKIADEIDGKKDDYTLLSWSYLTELLVFINRFKNTSVNTVPVSQDRNKKLSQVLDYINRQIDDENLSLQATASRFGFSTSNLSRLFSECTKFSFIEYINSIRITNACRLLKTTDMSIMDIAMETGFGSITQFDRSFKKLTGMTPYQYKKK